MDDDELVWYVGYGSNLLRRRFLTYLEGSDADGPFGHHRGARDATPPRDDRCVRFHHRLYFALRKTRWGSGGVAFVSPRPVDTEPGTTIGRAYLVTVAQFLDVAAQENGDPQLARNGFSSPATGDDVALGTSGRYNRVVGLEPLDCIPAVTLTTDLLLPLHPPGPAYLDVMRAGLAECSMPPTDVAAYLDQVARHA